MCHRVHCSTCGKLTWAGCGKHASQVMAGIAQPDRCTCEPTARGGGGGGGGLLARLFGRG